MSRFCVLVLCVPLFVGLDGTALAQEVVELRELVQAPAAPTPVQVRAALRRYHHEASVSALLRAIGELPELSAETITRLVRRGRLAALLPQVRGSARRGQAVDLSERIDDLRYSTDDSFTIELGLTWNLNRLVYGADEVALSREAARRHEAKVQRGRLIVSVYFERRRLQLERDLLGVVDLAHELRIEELGAMLDALSDGAFSRLSEAP